MAPAALQGLLGTAPMPHDSCLSCYMFGLECNGQATTVVRVPEFWSDAAIIACMRQPAGVHQYVLSCKRYAECMRQCAVFHKATIMGCIFAPLDIV